MFTIHKKLEYCFARERIVLEEEKQSVPLSNCDLEKKITVSCSVYDKCVFSIADSSHILKAKNSPEITLSLTISKKTLFVF